jgi:type I restriction enzyme, R subunit
MVYGFAKYMPDTSPNATYLGFTGTPVEKEDAKYICRMLVHITSN